MTGSNLIAPGATIGMLGSGQLGRMLAIAAREMGYRVRTFSPDADSPTGQVADLEVVAAYEDLDAVRAFAKQVDVVTFEFENVPSATADGSRGTRASAARRAHPARDAAARAREGLSRRSMDSRSHHSRWFARAATSPRHSTGSVPTPFSRPPASDTTGRGSTACARARKPRRPGAPCRSGKRSSSSSSRSSARCR